MQVPAKLGELPVDVILADYNHLFSETRNFLNLGENAPSHGVLAIGLMPSECDFQLNPCLVRK